MTRNCAVNDNNYIKMCGKRQRNAVQMTTGFLGNNNVTCGEDSRDDCS